MFYLRWSIHFELLYATLVLVVASTILESVSLGQGNTTNKSPVANNLLRPEYYVGLDYFADGQTVNANGAFGLAVSQSRSMGDQRGIDHVPALVMQGECLLAQCNIGAAMEKYDEAILLSFAARRWHSLLRNPTGPFRADPRVRDITWIVNKRATQMGQYPDAWQIAIATPEALVELSDTMAPGKLVAIDALEILRCQAIAFRRRHQLLGDLTKFMPLTAPVIESYRTNNSMSEPIACALNICRALAEWSNGERIQSIRLIKQNLSLANGLDHPLTAVGLLALSDAAIEANEPQEAEDRAMEAALASARAGQMDHLAESIEYMSKTAITNSHEISAVKTIQQIVAWAGNRSRLLTTRCQVELVRLASSTGDLDAFRKNVNLATTMLAPKQIALPRAEAVVSFAKARMDFLEGRRDDGESALRECAGQLGTPDGGIGTPSLFQFDVAIKLLIEIKNEVAANALYQTIRGPSAGIRRVHAMEQIPLLFANKVAASELLVEHRLATDTEADMVRFLDETTARRLRSRDEIISRAFDIQTALLSNPQQMNAAQINGSQIIRSQLPALAQNAARLSENANQIRSAPKWEIRKWVEDDSKRWESISRQADTLENMFLAYSLSNVHIPEMFPPVHSDELLKAVLQPTDAVIYFADVGSRIKAYAFVDGNWTSWTIAQTDALLRLINDWMNELQALKSRDYSTNEINKVWQNGKRLEIRNLLFPKEKWGLLNAAKRWIVVPTASLWMLPFEVLPTSEQVGALPVVAEHRIVYSPTLGLIPNLLRSRKHLSQHAVDLNAADYFSRNAVRGKEIRDDLARAGKHVSLELSNKGNSIVPTRYLKTFADQVFFYFPVGGNPASPSNSDRPSISAEFDQWRRLPWGTPAIVVMPGSHLLASMGQKNNDDFVWSLLPAIAQGTHHVLISRWNVGGESTANLMKTFIDNRQEMSAAEAWQRSVVSSWEERLDVRQEPIFRDAASGSSSDSQVSGFHPLLWAGYLNIGD